MTPTRDAIVLLTIMVLSVPFFLAVSVSVVYVIFHWLPEIPSRAHPVVAYSGVMLAYAFAETVRRFWKYIP